MGQRALRGAAPLSSKASRRITHYRLGAITVTIDLKQIFQPGSVDTFLRRVLGRHALLLEGAADRFRGVISWQTVNHLAAYGGLTFPRFRLVQGDQILDESLYIRRDQRGYPQPLVGETHALLRAGAILAIDGLELLHEPVAELCQAVEAALLVPVAAELYACWQEGAARNPQWDDHETLLIQVEGRKSWQLFEPTFNYAVGGSAPAPPGAEPNWSGTLGPGGLLYIPRGWWYQDKAFAEPSLYVALTFRNPTGIDMMARLLGKAQERELMRKDVPRFQNAEVQSSFLTLAQQELVSLANAPGLVRDLVRELQETSDPRAEFHFPWSAAANPLPPYDDWRLVPLLRFPAAFSMAWRVTTEQVLVPHNGTAVKLDWEAGSILEVICGSSGATVRGLLDICADRMPRDRVLDHLSELFRAGLVTSRPPAEGAGAGGFDTALAAAPPRQDQPAAARAYG